MKNAMQLKAIMKKLAKENQISAQLVLQNYMLERFLERVSLSPYRDNYIIKGGFLISSMVGLNSRATMDMDATIKGYPVTQDAVQKMIEQILTVPVDDDITFTFKSIGEIREGDEYTGYRVALTADFPPMAVPLKLDITTGDKITPREIQYDYKLMLEDRHIQVMAYNLATILAEKLETVISRSDQNTRPRDYYDVYILTKLQAENIDFPALGAALMLQPVSEALIRFCKIIEQLWKRCETARLCVGNGIITEKISTTLPLSALMKCVMQLLLQWTP